MNKRIIGIDLAVTGGHKAVVFNPASGEYIGKAITFRSTSDGLERVLKRARADAREGTQVVAVLEATGMSWLPVGQYLHRHGVEVYRVNGRLTKDLRKVFSRHAASDRIDSQVLAHLHQFMGNRLNQWEPPGGQMLHLQRACKESARWRERDTASQNRVKSYDQVAWNGLNKVVPAAARPWFWENWYNPWQVLEAGEESLRTQWAAAAPRQPAKLDWIPAWLARAKEMTELYHSPDILGYDEFQATILRQLKVQAQARSMRKELAEQIIHPLYQKLFPDCHLESIRGIGIDSAAIYMSFIQQIDRFSTVAQFRMWCGIVPGSKQSGMGETKGLKMTQAGPNLIKATLYQNAEVARQWDVQMASTYYTQMVTYGNHHTHAVCAVASHLANRIYAILKHNRPYQVWDLDGDPISDSLSRSLCLEHFTVPLEVRKRNNSRRRRQLKEDTIEARMHIA